MSTTNPMRTKLSSKIYNNILPTIKEKFPNTPVNYSSDEGSVLHDIIEKGILQQYDEKDNELLSYQQIGIYTDILDKLESDGIANNF